MRYVFALLLLSFSFAFAQSDVKQPQQTLRDSSLPESDRLAIQHKLKTDPDSADLTEDEILGTKIDAVDLNADEIPEILAQFTDQDDCGVVGNCTFWILQKHGTKYRALLKSIAQSYRIRTIKTGGFADVELGRHDSAYRTEWRGYKYNGKHYVKVKCWVDVYGDSEHKFRKPKVEPCARR